MFFYLSVFFLFFRGGVEWSKSTCLAHQIISGDDVNIYLV